MTPFCQAEDIAERITQDLALILPPSQILAEGTDGIIAPGEWVLSSATAAFETYGVPVGSLAILQSPGSSQSTSKVFVVSNVEGSTITLRRVGLGSGIGQPPGGAAGMSGVIFSIHYLDPQINDTTTYLSMIFGIDDNIPGRRYVDIYNLNDVIEIAISRIVSMLYLNAMMNSSNDLFKEKHAMHKAQYTDLKSAVRIRFGPTGSDNTSLFNQKLTR